MIPQKLQVGDEIRVIAPSRSLSIISKKVKEIAERKLGEIGLRVSYSKNSAEQDKFGSSSVHSRVADLHEVFSDEKVKGVLTVIGGTNVNQILSFLDYELIGNNPKILCGFSDITALSNAIYQKTGLVTYSGPHFSSFGMEKGIEHTVEYFKKCLMSEAPFEAQPSEQWSDDAWYLDQKNREFFDNDGPVVINEGEAEGKTIGGNIGTFNLLNGTEFSPKTEETILFVEEDDVAGDLFDADFDRNLQAILHQPYFSGVQAIVIGRFQKKGNIPKDKLAKIIKSKKELEDMPVVYGMDFGHTTPQITFPIGGTAKVSVKDGETKLEIIEH